MIRLFVRLSLVLVLLLSVVGTAYAADPDGSSPANAVQLTSTAAGTITGSKAGTFKYYSIAYPGGNTAGTLTIWFSPGNTSTAKALFLKLWQSGKLLASTDAYTLSTAVGMQKMAFSSASADPILLQLAYYEAPDPYQPGKTISYQLELKGLPAATAAPTAAAPAAPAPVTTAAPAAPAAPATPGVEKRAGVLAGSPSGSFAVYTITGYPGDGSSRTLSLNIGYVGYNLSNAIFLNVYQDGKLIGSKQGSKVAKLGDPLVLTFSSTSKSQFLVQIANYNAASTPPIGYELTYSK